MKWPENIAIKMAELERTIGQKESLLVAFSGGVDSTFLAAMCHRVLKEKALAVTASSSTYASREMEEAKQLASSLGMRHLIVESEELDIPGFTENSPRRCYFCKKALFEQLLRIAAEQGLKNVADGTNSDDQDDYRPGRQAAKECGVCSPLLECGITKDEIRQASQILELPTAGKPAFACLASRFPYGSRITAERLKQVEQVEDLLADLGFTIYRARHHGDTLRLELDKQGIARALDPATGSLIIQRARDAGFTYVTIDMEGYRTGSMNETLSNEERNAAS